MEFLDKEKSEKHYGLEIALKDSTIRKMFTLANIGKKDVFYDLGSGNGNIVRKVITYRRVKKAHGIEYDVLRFLCAVQDTKLLLNKKQFKKVEFWRADFTRFKFSNATVVYSGLSESANDVRMYNDVFKNKKGVKIITLNLPLVGYKPVKVDRTERENPLFLMETPLKKYRVNKKDWIRCVLGKKGKTINDVYHYYTKILQDLEPKERKSFLKDLRRLVKKRF